MSFLSAFADTASRIAVAKRRVAAALTAIVVAGTLNIAVVAPAQAATNVATLSIVSYGPGGTGGHSFLIVTNDTASAITVGTYPVPGKKSVTVGTWGNKPDGKGVYYDLEAYFSSAYGANKVWPGRVSLTIHISSSALAKLSKDIKANNTWASLKNCSWFASTVWDDVSPSATDVSARSVTSAGAPTPTSLAKNIKAKKGYKTNIGVPGATSSSVKRLSGGTNKKVSSGSLKKSSGSS